MAIGNLAKTFAPLANKIIVWIGELLVVTGVSIEYEINFIMV